MVVVVVVVVVDLAWEWVAMAIMEVWVEGDLGLEVGIMEDIMEGALVDWEDTMEGITVEEALVGIMAVDIMEEAGNILFLHGIMIFMCLYGFYDLC
ncbi:hypothetical protein ABOM_004572 [Aspergillus bombycis]|uniref:Uncharacterized protein n=1 Tax=Aspergillus bombycis TaxID=109264 RepID=A0A1F8A464_9EURO|nr:hypothetical protein ABOM_004572 [Aspergillus bombycis]OGM46532.1 hypothetical protein ABOM_004572 [Aspergillus bombycis]